jgi:hypothetical protein
VIGAVPSRRLSRCAPSETLAVILAKVYENGEWRGEFVGKVRRSRLSCPSLPPADSLYPKVCIGPDRGPMAVRMLK